MIYIDGDFDSEIGNCTHHCSPTCHPAQIGPEWVYGCRHKAWPQNRHGDFVPIVDCNGDIEKCELKNPRCSYFLGKYKSGLTRRINNARRKLNGAELELVELEKIFICIASEM